MHPGDLHGRQEGRVQGRICKVWRVLARGGALGFAVSNTDTQQMLRR